MAEIIYDAPQSPADLLPALLALPRGATVLVLGAPDCGKSTFVRNALSAVTGAGRSIAVVDCDLGQSEIGPPGTIGAAKAEAGAEVRSLRDLPVAAGYFIGAISSNRHTLEVCVGAVQTARAIKKSRPDLVLVDTDGYVQGREAQQFKRRLCELLLPQVIVALSRGMEIDLLLSAFKNQDSPDLWRVPAAEAVQRKAPAARATRRAARFLSALEGAEPLVFSFDSTALLGTSLGTGEPVAFHLLQFLSQALGRPALHAERSGGHLSVMVSGETWDASGLAAVESYFSVRTVSVTAAQKFAGLLVGLVSSGGVLLGVGRIDRIDFGRRTLTISTPCRKPGAVAQIWFGHLRLRADGRENGEVKPGEI